MVEKTKITELLDTDSDQTNPDPDDWIYVKKLMSLNTLVFV